MSQKKGKLIKWQKLTNLEKDSILKTSLALKNSLKNLDLATLPKKVKDPTNIISTQKKELDELLILNSRLNIMLNEERENYRKNEELFKEKAKSFSTKAQIEISKFKTEYQNKLEKEMAHFRKYGSFDLLEMILEPMTNIKMAIEVGKKQSIPELTSYLTGFEMLVKQLEDALVSQGLKIIKPQVGDDFNPRLETVIGTLHSRKNKGKIVEVKKNGYALHDRTIIPARVIVSK